MSHPHQAAHVPASAVLLAVCAVALFASADAVAKYLAQTQPVPLLVFERYSLQAVTMIIVLGPRLGLRLVRTAQLKLQLLRGGLLVVCSLLFIGALRWLPLADATALNFTSPVLVVLLSMLLLKERLTRARWAFVGAGFVGMLLIARPGAGMLQGAALLALGSSLCYALFQTLTRRLREEDSLVLLFYPAICGAVLMSLLLPFLDIRIEMTWGELGFGFLFGALATAGHFLFIIALQRAQASALTPYTYVQLIWATLLGWFGFGNFPDAYSLAGMAVIAASGLLLTWHERRRMLALTG